jgi:hypothetical protein
MIYYPAVYEVRCISEEYNNARKKSTSLTHKMHKIPSTAVQYSTYCTVRGSSRLFRILPQYPDFHLAAHISPHLSDLTCLTRLPPKVDQKQRQITFPCSFSGSSNFQFSPELLSHAWHGDQMISGHLFARHAFVFDSLLDCLSFLSDLQLFI